MKKSFCVIGLGKFGTSLALSLMERGCQVTVIDHDSDAVNSIADKVTNAVIGEPTNENVLRGAGVSDCDCAVVCTGNGAGTGSNDSVLITLILKELSVRTVIARAMSDKHRTILLKVGADKVVFPEKDSGEKLASLISRNGLLDYFEFSDDYSIAEIAVPASWIGLSIAEMNIRKKYKVTVIAVKHQNGRVDITPEPDYVFREGDTVSVVGKSENVDKICS